MGEVQGAKKTKFIPETALSIFVAEFVGTGLLLFLGCMGCVTEAAALPVTHHTVSLTFGLAVVIVVQIFAHISGAHVNPAVTLAAVILGYVKPLLGSVYVVAQFAGATLGFGLLKILIPDEYTTKEIFSHELNQTITRIGLCSTVPSAKLSSIQAVGIEVIITAALILVCCAIWDQRNASNMDSVPLRIGLVIAGIGMAAGPFTGGSMNSARSFGPALLNGDWMDHWIYWIGPTLGAVLASLFYKYTYPTPRPRNEEDELRHLEEIGNRGSSKK